jgi:hypothetical protein
MKTRRFFLDMCVVALATPSLLAQQTQQPIPSPAVLAKARQIMAIMGNPKPIEAPSSVESEIVKYTGHREWTIWWSDTRVTIDEVTLKPRGYTAMHQYRSQVIITEQQARNNFSQLAQALNLPTTWIIDHAGVEYLYHNPNTNPSWEMDMHEFLNGYAIGGKRLFGSIHPETGKIEDWALQEEAICIPPQSPIIPYLEALTRARSAYNQMIAPLLQPGEAEGPVSHVLVYAPIDEQTTISRLTYKFFFRLPTIPNPNADEEPVRPGAEIWADIDAETGDMSIACVSGSAGLPSMGTVGTNKGTPVSRSFLISDLVQGKAPISLLKAIYGGKFSDKYVNTVPKNLQRFTHPARSGDEVTLGYDSKKRILYWKMPTTVPTPKEFWFTFTLNEKLGKGVSDWLKSRSKPVSKLMPTTKPSLSKAAKQSSVKARQ